MPRIQPVRIPNFQGGLNKADKTIIEDNQLSEATNVFYNQDKNLETRNGKTSFGAPIPDAAVLIHSCDSYNSNGTWGVADDAVTISTEASDQRRGAGAVQFDIDVSASVNNYATVSNSTFTQVDITNYKSYLTAWVYFPAGGLSSFTSIEVKLGSDSSNYYSWTITAAQLVTTGWRFLKLDFDDATETGTVVDTAIDYSAFVFNYVVAYVDQTGLMIDAIYCYSPTATKPMMSLLYFESSSQADGFPKSLLTNVGTNLFEYNSTSEAWEVIKTGLTTNTRFSMAPYKNIMYLTNGTDNFMDYDFNTVTERTGANTYKGKYVILANDRGYIAGDPSVPTTLGYTNGVPTNLQTFPNALVVDEDGSDGVITGLINLGPIVFVMKERKIYQVNVATPSREAIDYSSGFLSHRALVNAENEIYGINNSGIFTVGQRQATVGSVRADARSDDIQVIIDAIQDKTIVSAIYVEALKQIYFFCDTSGDNVADTALVYSLLTRGWTTYNNMAVNQAVVWRDSDNVEHLLIANAATGQCQEIETGLDDNGVTITSVIQTKDFDFSTPELYKTVTMVEIFGFMNEGGEVKFSAYVEDEDATGEITLDDDYIDIAMGTSYTLGTSPLGTTPLGGSGGEASDTVLVYPFKARIPMYATGSRIYVKLRVATTGTKFIFTKASIYAAGEALDIYPNSKIA